MNRIHRHRPIPSRRRDSGWTQCITPAACAASPRRQSAHGGLHITDYCACGARRRSERNQGSVNRGPWLPPDGERL